MLVHHAHCLRRDACASRALFTSRCLCITRIVYVEMLVHHAHCLRRGACASRALFTSRCLCITRIVYVEVLVHHAHCMSALIACIGALAAAPIWKHGDLQPARSLKLTAGPFPNCAGRHGCYFCFMYLSSSAAFLAIAFVLFPSSALGPIPRFLSDIWTNPLDLHRW